jgi:hypothetical protein
MYIYVYASVKINKYHLPAEWTECACDRAGVDEPLAFILCGGILVRVATDQNINSHLQPITQR